MCYQIYNHKSLCDVCTIISGNFLGAECKDHSIAYVNPYAEPMPCSCPMRDMSIAPFLRCDTHSCCRVAISCRQCSRAVKSGKKCIEPRAYHHYERRRCASLKDSKQDPEPVVPLIDASIGNMSTLYMAFPHHEDVINATANLMFKKDAELQEAKVAWGQANLEALEVQGRMACDMHERCRIVLREEWECRAFGAIKEWPAAAAKRDAAEMKTYDLMAELAKLSIVYQAQSSNLPMVLDLGGEDATLLDEDSEFDADDEEEEDEDEEEDDEEDIEDEDDEDIWEEEEYDFDEHHVQPTEPDELFLKPQVPHNYLAY